MAGKGPRVERQRPSSEGATPTAVWGATKGTSPWAQVAHAGMETCCLGAEWGLRTGLCSTRPPQSMWDKPEASPACPGAKYSTRSTCFCIFLRLKPGSSSFMFKFKEAFGTVNRAATGILTHTIFYFPFWAGSLVRVVPHVKLQGEVMANCQIPGLRMPITVDWMLPTDMKQHRAEF